MGLLPYLTAHALDEDYAHAAAHAGTQGAARGPGRFGRGAAAVLAVFAVLAVTAAVQTSKDSPSDERQRSALIGQVKERRSAVADQRRSIEALTAQVRRLEADQLRNQDSTSGVFGTVALLGLRSGTAAARGPGVEVVVDDAPDAKSDRNKVLDSDLQKLVNGLWRAGAEAISINGERLTTFSAIRHAGTAITVNFTSLNRPYRILAIGNPDTLPRRFSETTSGQEWLDLQRQVGLKFSIRTQSTLRLPGADVPQLRYVKPAAKESSGAKGSTAVKGGGDS